MLVICLFGCSSDNMIKKNKIEKKEKLSKFNIIQEKIIIKID